MPQSARAATWVQGPISRARPHSYRCASSTRSTGIATPPRRRCGRCDLDMGGPNGAIVHYRVTRKSNRRIKPGDLLLIDSGAQYEDGTTDVTRTIAIGAPTSEMRDRFTRVLRGHIAVAS